MESKTYDTLVVSSTYDLERLVMYPEKAAVQRTYEQIRHLISSGHIVEVRDKLTNVVVDSIEKLDLLYKPSDYDNRPSEVKNPNEPEEVSSRFIKLPNGTVLDVNTLMNENNEAEKNGYNIPQYIQSTPDVLPKAVVNVELNERKPENNETAAKEEIKEESSKENEKKAEEQTSENNDSSKNKNEGDGK